MQSQLPQKSSFLSHLSSEVQYPHLGFQCLALSLVKRLAFTSQEMMTLAQAHNHPSDHH